MSDNLHPDATPNVRYTGANDIPAKGASKPIARFANFTTLNPIMASWGDTSQPLAISNGAEAERHYGPDVFNVNSPCFNYQTTLTELQIQGGTPSFPWRMELAGMAKANGRLLIEIVEDELVDYARNIDGTYTLLDGAKVPLETKTLGIKYRYLYENNLTDFSMGGAASGAPGTLTGTVGGEAKTSLIYPIADFEGLWMGTFGDLLGITFSVPKDFSIPVPAIADVAELGNAIYRMGITVLPTNGGSPTKLYTESSSATMDFMLEPMIVNSKNVPRDFESVYESSYSVKKGTTSGSKYKAPIVVHLYEEDIATVLTALHAKEFAAKDLIDPVAFVTENKYSINMFEGFDNFNVPYMAIRQAAATDMPNANTVNMNGTKRLALKGGNDGDTGNAAFNVAVKEAFDNIQYKFPVTDSIQYPFKWVLDLGLDQETSESLWQILQHRNDVAVVAATHEHGKALQTTTDIMGSALGLSVAASMFPESVIYTTPASRGAIMGYTVKLVSGTYRYPIAATFELAQKLQAYLGRTDGRWVVDRDPLLKNNKPFANELMNFKSEPYLTRSELWNKQLIALGSVAHETVGLVGLQSVNPNDSSVLNSLLVIAALLSATHAATVAAVNNQGRTDLPSVIASDIDKETVEQLKGVDKSKARFTVKTVQTQSDVDNAFSLTTKITVEGGNQITANTVEITTMFMKDEAQA